MDVEKIVREALEKWHRRAANYDEMTEDDLGVLQSRDQALVAHIAAALREAGPRQEWRPYDEDEYAETAKSGDICWFADKYGNIWCHEHRPELFDEELDLPEDYGEPASYMPFTGTKPAPPAEEEL